LSSKERRAHQLHLSRLELAALLLLLLLLWGVGMPQSGR
jgi:hypothetical protein